jgi:hypothetical protein
MDITALVTAAAVKHQVYATSAHQLPPPLPGVHLAAITFPNADQAETFAAACMGDGIPARHVGAVDGEPTVVILF